MIPKREYRVLSQEEIDARRRLGMILDHRVLRKEGILLPVSGGSPDDGDDDDDGDGSGDDDDDDDSGDGDSDDDDDTKNKNKNKKSKKSGKSGSSSDDDDDSDDDDEEVKVPKNELARLRRKAKEKDDLDKKAKKDREEADRKKKQEEGRWQELVDEEREKTTTAEKERDEAKEELAEFKWKVNVSSIAQRLGFKDPTDAFRFLDKKELLDAEEDILESALKKVLKNKDYLKADRKSTGGSRGGGNGASGNWDISEIKKMSPDEINENWNKPGFQEAIQQAGV